MVVFQANACISISGLVVEYIVAIDVTRVRFPADARMLAGVCLASEGCRLFRDVVGRAKQKRQGWVAQMRLLNCDGASDV